jgi:hypothetical protein
LFAASAARRLNAVTTCLNLVAGPRRLGRHNDRERAAPRRARTALGKKKLYEWVGQNGAGWQEEGLQNVVSPLRGLPLETHTSPAGDWVPPILRDWPTLARHGRS